MENFNNKDVKTKKELLKQRMMEKYPDIDVEDEEVFFEKISDDFDGFDKELEGYKERENTFADLFNADPRSATFLTKWRQGGDPMIELVRVFGTDGLKEAIENPDKLDELAEANREYLDRVAKSNAFEEEFKKNLAVSIENIDKIEGSDEDVDKAIEWLFKIGRDASRGIVNPEDVALAIKAMTFDKSVEDAAYEGEVKGRNAKIVEKMRSARNDGTVQLGSRTAPVRTRNAANSIFDVAEGAR